MRLFLASGRCLEHPGGLPGIPGPSGRGRDFGPRENAGNCQGPGFARQSSLVVPMGVQEGRSTGASETSHHWERRGEEERGRIDLRPGDTRLAFPSSEPARKTFDRRRAHRRARPSAASTPRRSASRQSVSTSKWRDLVFRRGVRPRAASRHRREQNSSSCWMARSGLDPPQTAQETAVGRSRTGRTCGGSTEMRECTLQHPRS